MMAWAVAATVAAVGLAALLVYRERHALPPLVPLLGTRLQTVQAFRVFNSPEGRLVLLHLAREFVFRDQVVPGDPQATASRCGEAALAMRLLGLASPRVRQQVMETLIQQEMHDAR